MLFWFKTHTPCPIARSPAKTFDLLFLCATYKHKAAKRPSVVLFTLKTTALKRIIR